MEWYFGGDLRLTALGPVRDYEDLNSASVVSRLDFGENSFLFNGDQEADAEADVLASGADVDADMMTAGHHGSRTSSSAAYREAVSPEFVSISCGADNSYGHPHQETLDAFADCTVNRTDWDGDIAYVSDGREITVITRGKH